MGKLTQKQRRELKKTPYLNDNKETNKSNYELQNDYLKQMECANTSDRVLTDLELKQITTYFMSRRRTITFNGTATHEITNMTDDIISFHGLSGCFLSILTSAITCDDLQISFLHQWVKEKDQIMYLKLNANDDVVSFAILHKTDFDPYRKHKKPYVLCYIYTYEQYRNKGHAQSLIQEIKTKQEFTALCNSNLSYLVCQKCGLKEHGTMMGLRVMRT